VEPVFWGDPGGAGVWAICAPGAEESQWGMGLGVPGLQCKAAAPVGGGAGPGLGRAEQAGAGPESRALCLPGGFGEAPNPASGCCCGLGRKGYQASEPLGIPPHRRIVLSRAGS